MKKLLILGLLSISLIGCSKNSKEVVTNESSQSIQESSKDYSVNSPISVEKLPEEENIKNPRNEFVDNFLVDKPMNKDALREEGIIVGGLEDIDGGDYSINHSVLVEYSISNELTTELYERLKEEEPDFAKTSDFDHDGLTDYEEIEIYKSNPNKMSTAGDSYTDKYKVENKMDLNKVYDMEWQKVNGNEDVLYLPGDSYSFLAKEVEVWDNYLDDKNVFVISVGFNFIGDLKFLAHSSNNYKVELLNTYDNSLKEIEVEKKDSYILIHTLKGYDKYKVTKIN